MKTIWKYPLEITGIQTIELPGHANILSVKDQNGILTLWAELDTEDKSLHSVDIYIVGTGNPITFETKYMESPQYFDSVIMGSFVWHVYIKE